MPAEVSSQAFSSRIAWLLRTNPLKGKEVLVKRSRCKGAIVRSLPDLLTETGLWRRIVCAGPSPPPRRQNEAPETSSITPNSSQVKGRRCIERLTQTLYGVQGERGNKQTKESSGLQQLIPSPSPRPSRKVRALGSAKTSPFPSASQQCYIVKTPYVTPGEHRLPTAPYLHHHYSSPRVPRQRSCSA